MFSKKISIVLLALVAGAALAQAAAGVKGVAESQQRFQAIKGPRQQAPLAPRIPAASKGAGQVAPIFSAARVAPVAVKQPQQEPEPEVQQQQQVEETEPNPAAQDPAPAVAVPAPAGPAPSEEEANPRPEPYAFNYAFAAGDSATSGSSQREEQQDANGRVTGFYTLRGEDGRDRRVDYVADANGFRATISTNELGTAPKNSADVDWQAQPATDAQLRAAESATAAARQRAALEPQSQLALPAAAASQRVELSKAASPRQAAASQLRQVFAPAAKGQPQQQPQQQQQIISQLQEPFEQIRQSEFANRARKSRQAPFYLFTN